MATTQDLFVLPELALEEPWTDQQWGLAQTTAQGLFAPSNSIDEDRLFSSRPRQVNSFA